MSQFYVRESYQCVVALAHKLNNLAIAVNEPIQANRTFNSLLNKLT